MPQSIDDPLACIRQGDMERAARILLPALRALEPDARNAAVEDLIAYARTFGGDPIAFERFCGRVWLAAARDEEGAAALARAQAWEAARETQEQGGVNLADPVSMYTYLGATDFHGYALGGPRSDAARQLLNEKTLGYLIMAQQMEKLLPLLRHFPGASWLTVGDGRHAFEARFLMKHGAKVLPSNLDVTLLEEAKREGYIREYAKENLEKLSFADNSFDFVCCKETLHHVYRPYLGLYEMMRIAKEGVFLLEPFDHGSLHSAVMHTRPQKGSHHFEEEAGNYAYSFSERELEKLCVSLGWRTLAVRGINMLEDAGANGSSTDPRDLRAYQARVAALDDLAAQRKIGWRCLGALLLRHEPAPALKADLEETGFTVISLPVNPYMQRAVLQKLQGRAGFGEGEA